MGSITRGFANNITTSGILLPGAVNNNSFDSVTSVPDGSVTGGSMNHISTTTITDSASVEFTSGLDSTYDEYVFLWTNIHPQYDSTHFSFHVSTDGGSTYSANFVSTAFRAIHNETDTGTGLGFHNDDGATAQFALHNENRYQIIASYLGNDTDQHGSGYLHLFSPSSTTHTKQFYATATISNPNDYIQHDHTSGYINTTSAINAISFRVGTGTGGTNGSMQDGQISMYGIG